MPTVHTISGARRRHSGGSKTAHQRKFGAAAKACSGKSRVGFHACMKQKLRR